MTAELDDFELIGKVKDRYVKALAEKDEEKADEIRDCMFRIGIRFIEQKDGKIDWRWLNSHEKMWRSYVC